LSDRDFLGLPLGAFLDQVQERSSAPGGGAVSALVVAMAAGLCAMAGRFGQKPGAGSSPVVERALALAAAARPLADADAVAYSRLLEARRLPREPDPEPRRRAIALATTEAVDVPLQVARIGADAARLGATLAAEGNPNLRGDAVAGALLAAAAARAAATLVAINLPDERDPRVQESRTLASQAEDLARRALEATG
jgi:methenyltetrahydrofolate cyclohydrolase